MVKKDVKIGGKYTAKISDKMTVVQIIEACDYGGWYALNLKTGREVRVRTAGKLRGTFGDRKHSHES